jgi:two-component system chemotaxis response regulator CheB
MFPSMPEHALQSVNVDYVVPLSRIAPLLVQLTAAPVAADAPRPAAPEDMEIEVKIAREEDPLDAGVESLGAPSPIACPECHGVLRQWKEAGRIRFRCHTGHAYAADSLLAEIGEAIETQMWNAIRSLQEGSILIRQLAGNGEGAHGTGGAARLKARAAQLDKQAAALRDMLQGVSAGEPDPLK